MATYTIHIYMNYNAASTPPSTDSVTPLIILALSLSRNNVVLAISSTSEKIIIYSNKTILKTEVTLQCL